MDPVLVGTVPSRVWMCLGSGSNALSPKFATGKTSRTVEGWELANKLGSQQTEEAVAGDPLGNKFIIIIILVIIINSNNNPFQVCEFPLWPEIP